MEEDNTPLRYFCCTSVPVCTNYHSCCTADTDSSSTAVCVALSALSAKAGGDFPLPACIVRCKISPTCSSPKMCCTLWSVRYNNLLVVQTTVSMSCTKYFRICSEMRIVGVAPVALGRQADCSCRRHQPRSRGHLYRFLAWHLRNRQRSIEAPRVHAPCSKRRRKNNTSCCCNCSSSRCCCSSTL